MSNLHNVAQYILLVILLGLASVAAAQDSASGDHVRVRWLAPESFVAGETETIGFYFEVDPEWHVYWRNAGDSGAAPRFDIASDTAAVGEIQWPFPVRLPIEHLTNLGYKGNVAYLFEVTPAAGADTLSLKANLEWLVCRINCIPGFGSMRLERPVGPASSWNSGDRALRDRFAQRVPRPGAGSPWRAISLSESGGEKVRLTLEGPGQSPRVFPLDGELLTATEPALRTDGDRIHYTFERVPGSQRPETAGFVATDGERAWRFDAIPFGAASSAPTDGQATALWWLLLAAFAGGAVLNLMPCVFPVLSIKLFGLINTGTDTAGRLREGLVYSAGVLVTFAALGGLLLALRAGGAAVGWGFQLQSAPVVLALILLFWLMALSFSGVFEFGHRLMNIAGSSRGGSFATGVLAVFVAAPCTGPFMGAALGAAAVLPSASAMALFLGLGAGLAAPFVLLCASPALLKRLPAPGPWMDKFRQLLAFPLYATVIWLLWVLGRLLGDSGWLIGTLLLLAVVFALWLGRNFARAGRVAGYLLAVGALVAAFGALRSPESEPQLAQGEWQPYDKIAIERARADGRAVFIDYTAAWCITCQVNKKLVLDTPAAMKLFADHDVLLVRADWTNHDSEITRALAQLGRNSVPVYAWYAPGAEEPELLPQILQKRMIVALFDEKSTLQLAEDETP
ncbi:protein-disulfide reductase DsbD family protein [Microbulbifer halophilus]|uniref:Protein-disulfide reductase DsbD family protein n=1 Tax=Microbulbifer halophilus TaxID=453963 RepID=A0ABW5EDU4_9GAMM|nr:thioredoxin family protein [Microbulbifer halophilus]MCW8125324.1 protein-disulfide reductase DsbD family protein [Microbulbifer halophilus]